MKILDFFSGGIDKTLKSVKDIVTTFVPDKGLQQQINAEIDKQAHDIKLKQMEHADKVIDAELQDRVDARKMYTESIKSNDVFIRRFPMLLAGSVLILAGIILVGMLFMEIPDANRDIINISLGSLLGSGVVSVINFFFGSSYEDKHKD